MDVEINHNSFFDELFQVIFSIKDPPHELKGTDAKSGDDVGYITFVLLPSHFKEQDRRDKTIGTK